MNIKNLTYEKNKIVKLFNQKKFIKILNITQLSLEINIKNIWMIFLKIKN